MQSSLGLSHMAAAGGNERAGAVSGDTQVPALVPLADARGGDNLSLAQSVSISLVLICGSAWA